MYTKSDRGGSGYSLELIGIGDDFLNRVMIWHPRRSIIHKMELRKHKSFSKVNNTVI